MSVARRLRERWAEGGDPWWRATVVLVGAVLVLLLLLAVTGVILSFTYRPSAAQALGGAEGGGVLRSVHAVASTVLVLNAFGLLVAGLGLAFARQRKGVALLMAAGGQAVLFGALLGASFTGFLLAWDQLALSTVTTGDYDGIWSAAFDDSVRLLIIDGVEVEPGTYAVWALTHTLVLPLLILGLLGGLVRVLASGSPRVTAPRRR
jgi:quinol-cytochrome oxidoreductase complex cytochrome b subunit